MGTPEFALPSLQALARCPAHQVLLVVTQPDKPKGRSLGLQMPPVKELALELGIPVMQPEKLRGNGEVLQAFENLALDAAIVVAYGSRMTCSRSPAWDSSTSTHPSCPVSGARHQSTGPSSRGAPPPA